MARIICENCMWGDQCPAKDGCDNYTPLENFGIDDITTHDKTEYEYEWQLYMHTWRGNDKWGDSYDE